MAWLRRDDQTTSEGEREWISDLLDPLHGRSDDPDHAPESGTPTATGTDPAKSRSSRSQDGTPRRSAAEVIAAAEPDFRQPPARQAAGDESDDLPTVEPVDRSPDDDAAPAATRSAGDVLAAANRTGETTGSSTTEPNDTNAAELPANYAARVPTTGEIPAIDQTRTNVAPTLAQIMLIDGALGTALVDYASGETLDSRSTDGAPDIVQSAAAESAVIRTKIANLVQLDSHDDVDEVFTTLGTQYHLTQMVRETATPGLFLYLIVDRELANLAMARHKLALAARQLEV